MPTVIVDSPAIESDELDFVGIDDRGAAETAVRHLLDLGHRRLAILSLGLSAYAHPGPAGMDVQDQATASVPKARLQGCARAMAAARLDSSAVAVEQSPRNSIESGRARAHALLDRAPGVTALFAFSDPLALGARMAARERGLSVPGDLSIVGFDDTAPASEDLTSVHQPLRDKGRIAAERLLSPGPPGPRVLLPTSLVLRGSTGPPR